ncbi:EutN/CcmL family microcompartment protein [bacterium]|jgi:ethanolamine utilization protein EutN|nr:EutN/CcmL family microcompartment protein [bacterium]
MILGKVIGTVWATRKDEQLRGLTLQLVRELDPDGSEKSRYVVAVDSVGAGVGETVLFVQGSSARQTEVTKNKPIDAVIVAIVDKMDVEGNKP